MKIKKVKKVFKKIWKVLFILLIFLIIISSLYKKKLEVKEVYNLDGNVEKIINISEEELNKRTELLTKTLKLDLKDFYFWNWEIENKNELHLLEEIKIYDWNSPENLKKRKERFYLGKQFYKNIKWKVFVVTSKWVYFNDKVIFEKNNLGLWRPIYRWLGEINWKLTFVFNEIVDLNKDNNYLSNNCELSIKKYEEKNKKCKTNFILGQESNLAGCISKISKDNYTECIEMIMWKKTTTNIFYNWEFFNQKYNLEWTKQIFWYNWKIGFVAKKNWKFFIMYDWKKVSNDFDYVTEKAYPFNIYDNWLLQYVFKRWNKYFINYIKLK